MPNARTTDPTTSHEAAASVNDITLTQKRVLRIITDSATPVTDERLVEEFVSRYGDKAASPSGIRSRRHELAAAGKVVAHEVKGLSRSGRSATRWVVKS